MTQDAVSLEDFYALGTSGKFIFARNGKLWPAEHLDKRFPRVQVGTDDDGNPIKIKPSVWIARRRPVDDMTWVPGKPTIIKDMLVMEGGLVSNKGCKLFNQYRPPLPPTGNPEQAGKWLDHIEALYPNDHRHVVNWFAHRVQHPGIKINHALVLGGPPKIGKDSVLHPVIQAVGHWNTREVQPLDLTADFNPHIKCVILRVNEARDNGDARYQLYEHTKILLAAPPDVLTVNEKHVPQYAVSNIVGVVFTTNHRAGGLYLDLEANDRRHFVAWSEATPEDFDQAYWDDLWDWYTTRNGCQHVASYLASLNLDGFSPTAAPPKTPAFWTMVNADRSSEDAALADVIDGLGNPVALCKDNLLREAEAQGNGLADFLREGKNASKLSHRLEKIGYFSIEPRKPAGRAAYANGKKVRHSDCGGPGQERC